MQPLSTHYLLAPSSPTMFSPAAERNKAPIAQVLVPHLLGLQGAGRLLEIACGGLQHACYMAAQVPQLHWQPTDLNAEVADYARTLTDLPANLAMPRQLDVTCNPWPAYADGVDVIYSANMLHIAPLAVTEGLLAGAQRHLAPAGMLWIYGPFKLGGEHTSEGNQAFDAQLRQRNPEWGIRDLDMVLRSAAVNGLQLIQRTTMPANNQLLQLQRQS